MPSGRAPGGPRSVTAPPRETLAGCAAAGPVSDLPSSGPYPMHVVLLIALGLAVGSFLTVCIHRLPRGESVVAPRSHCPACARPLRWSDNVPLLGYLRLQGSCRACGAPISPLYPTVELITPLLFVLQYGALGWQPLLPARIAFACALLVLAAIDLRHRILPNVVTLPGTVLGLILSLGLEPGPVDALAGAAVGAGVPLAIAVGYRRLRGVEGLGMGDVKMLAMIGAWLGWQAALLTLLLASLLGSLAGLTILASGRGDARYPLPFGSFLAVAAFASTLVGDELIAWYAGFY